jgi:magnesium chelatase family protein
MTRASAYSVALTGVTGHVIEIDTEVTDGLPGVVLAGLPDTALREARDRVRAAIVNSAEPWPDQRITVRLFPASLPGPGSCSDTAIAVGVLAAAGLVPAGVADGIVFIAELGLDGRLRPVRGVLPSVAAARAAGFSTVVVASGNAAEAALVPAMTVIPATTLTAVLAWLRGARQPDLRAVPAAAHIPGRHTAVPVSGVQPGNGTDVAQVLIPPAARPGLDICAAGGHHLSLLGPPQAGKILAGQLPAILPRLDTGQALEVASIRSVAGTLPPDVPLVRVPPFLAPHHTSSKAAITGGGTGSIRPGAASLAHRGVLFLDQAPEFDRDVLDALREPLESGQITVARSGITAVFPARFILVLGATPCPCAATASPAEKCTCSPATRKRYLGRISGPLLDRVDVKINLIPAGHQESQNDRGAAEPSTAAAVRVAAARDRAAHRLKATPWQVSAEIPGSELRRHWPPAPGALTMIQSALDRGLISERGAVQVVRVAWTIADLAGTGTPGTEQCTQALEFFLGRST